MDKNTEREDVLVEDKGFPMREYISTCISKWKWFVLSVIVVAGLGYLYILRQAPKYSRTMSVLVKDQQSRAGIDMSSAMSQFGFGGGNPNVYNELISMKSPSVIADVVKILQLNVNVVEKGTFHGNVLFGSGSPLKFEMPELNDHTNFLFRMDLEPDDSFRLYKFVSVSPAGKKTKFEYEVKGRLSDNPVNTPVGKIYLRSNPEYAGTRDEQKTIYISVSGYASTTESYLNKIEADLADTDAEVVNVTIEDTNIERAVAILNTLLDVYNRYWLEDRNAVTIATSRFISERLQMLSGQLDQLETAISDYKTDNKIPNMSITTQMFTAEALNVNQQVLSVNNQLSMVRYLRDYINNPGNRLSVIPVNTGVGSATLERLIQDYNTMLLQRQNLAKNSGDSNPLVVDYDTRLNGLREAIDRSLTSQVGTLEATLRSMAGEQGKTNTKFATLPGQSKEMRTMERDREVLESLYTYLLQKREETDLQAHYAASNTRVITPPYGSIRPISPHKTVIMGLCLILGFTIPAALIYLIIYSNDTVNSRHDLENLPIPFAGEIPQIGKKHKLSSYLKTKKQRQKDIDKPKPIVAPGKRDVPNEAFRVVRSNIDLMLGRNNADKVIMVTSFNPGSGKSFVAFNLGASFALKGKKVLLIDGDLRHGSMSTYVDSPHRGMSSYLQGNTDDVDALIKRVDNFEHLYVLPIGHRPPNPAELLETDRFGEMLTHLKEEYDMILVDCPPVNVVVDTQLLNRYADRTLFVVRAGLLKRDALRDIITLHDENKLARMSLLLNGTEAARSSYYTYGNYQGLEG